MFGPDFSITSADCVGFHAPGVRDDLDQPLARFARCQGDGIADHVGLAARAGMRGFRRTRRIVVADDHMLGLHTHFVRGDLGEHGKNPLTDLGDTGDDLRAAAVIELGPSRGAIDHGCPRDAVPAGSHSSSALAGHRVYSAASCFSAAAKRAPSAQGGRISSLLRSLRLAPRETGAPASHPEAFSTASSARVRLTEPSFAFVWVTAPSRIALMRRIWNGSSPSRSAQMSRWDSVANAVCRAPNERKAPDGVLLV